MRVALYMGAWIETGHTFCIPADPNVALYMGAWIETPEGAAAAMPGSVALYMGAWIETDRDTSRTVADRVALYMGAWIETISAYKYLSAAKSHSIWVRGLKHPHKRLLYISLLRRTLYGCVD